MNYKYFPVLRARQQEMDVLEKFAFDNRMVPVVEIIKEKARSNQKADGHIDYAELLKTIQSESVIIDLPIYLDPTLSTASEVRTFFLTTISNLSRRIDYYKLYNELSQKVIPTLSTLQPHSDEANTLITQFKELSPIYPRLAFRIYINRFDEAIEELKKIHLRENDIIIYDIDKTDITSPLIRKHKTVLNTINSNNKVIVRSAINTDIQNVKLDHGEIIPEANNSLRELYFGKPYEFPAFGDFAGVKKDDITSGGTISPGFILYNPEDNLYYGFKGRSKSLSEFETTIVPDVLNFPAVKHWIDSKSPFTEKNPAILRLQQIGIGTETGKNQAKFKWIAIMHYLHCMKALLESGEII